MSGRQKLCEGTRGLRRKVWIGTKLLSPNIQYFVAILSFDAIYAPFLEIVDKKVIFLVENSFGQDVHYYMVHIAYHT